MLPYNLRELLNDNSLAVAGLSLMFYLMSLPLLYRLGQFVVFVLWLPAVLLVQSTWHWCGYQLLHTHKSNNNFD